MILPPKSFNRNFEADIKSAGLTGLPFSWGSGDSFLGLDDPRLTAEQKSAILGIALRDTPLAPAMAAPEPGSTRSDALRFLAMKDANAMPGSVGGVSGGDATGLGGPSTMDFGFDPSPTGGHFSSGVTGDYSGAGGKVGGLAGATIASALAALTGPAAPFTGPAFALGGRSLGESAGRAIGGLFSSEGPPVGPPSTPEPDTEFDPYEGGPSGAAGPTGGPVIGANQAGFSTSPFSTGTPFSANPVSNPEYSGKGTDPADAGPGPGPGPTGGSESGNSGQTGSEGGPGPGGSPSGSAGPSGEGGPSGDGGPSSGDYGRGGRVGRKGHGPAGFKGAKKFSGGGPVDERSARLARIKAFEAKNGKVAI